MFNAWKGNDCNILSGYFTKNCEDIDAAGKNKVTICPMRKFWTGVRSVGQQGLDHLKFQCCEAEYHEPVSPPLRMRNGPHGNFYFRN